MRLGVGDRWVEMAPVGYEAQDLVRADVDDDLGDHWLVLNAEVAGSAGALSYGGISRKVAADGVGLPEVWNRPQRAFEAGSVIAFVEPDVAARVTSRDGNDISLRWYFEDAASTADLSDDPVFVYDFMSYTASTVDLLTSPTQLIAAAA